MVKNILKKIIYSSVFKPVHIGDYIRGLCFNKYIIQYFPNFIKVMDAGCGNGNHSFMLVKKFPHLLIDAYDIKKFKTWNNNYKNIQFFVKDLRDVKISNYYDFCYSIDVIEHIPDNRLVFQNIFDALKPKGIFYLHVPSKIQKTILPKKYFNEFSKWAKEEHIGDMYNIKELEEILKKIGFNIVYSRKTFGFLGSISWELDRITDKRFKIKIILMPLLKLLGKIDCYLKIGKNGILIIAQKVIDKDNQYG